MAAAHPLGAEAGKAMLDKKGNAVDAVVAAAFTMAVVGPYHSGLGGGGFAVVHDLKRGEAVFDFREVAPIKATHDMYVRDGGFEQLLATDGPLAIAVPGAIAGYLELHERYGTLPRATVLEPAIRAATDGFVVTPKYAALAAGREACLRKDSDAAAIYLREGADGALHAPALGTVLKQPDLARTLKTLAKEGPKAFYSGAIGKALVADLTRKGALLTAEDLAHYRPRWRAPLEGNYRGHRVLTVPPPSAGGLALLEVLGVLEHHGPLGPASRDVEVMHVFIEALRRAFAERATVMGDPAFVEVPVQDLLSAAHLKALLSSIDLKAATKSTTMAPSLEKARVEPKNTTHISVIDAAGNAVALTTTVNYYFGSCVVAKGTGILLNDEMDDFAALPGVPNVFGLIQGEANAIAPKKIPVSSMTPTLVFQQGRPTEVMLAVGSPGGSTIPTTVMQVISNLIDGKLDVVQAVGRGRIHHQYQPDVVMVDKSGLEPATAQALTQRGHVLKASDNWGDAEAVFVDPVTGLRTAGSDPRNEGHPAGQP